MLNEAEQVNSFSKEKQILSPDKKKKKKLTASNIEFLKSLGFIVQNG